MAGQAVGDEVDQVCVGELAGRQVGSDLQRGPTGGVARRLFDHPPAEREDQSGVGGDRDERTGLHQADAGPVPAQQRLDADHGTVPQAHDRLEVQHHLVGPQGLAQGVLHLEAGHRLVPQADVEQGRAVAAPLLGVVHRQVGVLEQLGRVGRAGGVDHADAGRHHDPAPGQVDGRGQGIGQAGRQCGHRLGTVEVRAQHHELVAADARYQVGRTQGPAEAVAHLLQQLVAGIVAEAVVDELEAVEVDEQEPGSHPFVSERVSQPRQQLAAVGEAGEVVVERAVGEAGLEVVAVDGDGGEVGRERHEVAIIGQQLAVVVAQEDEPADQALGAGEVDGERPDVPTA